MQASISCTVAMGPRPWAAAAFYTSHTLFRKVDLSIKKVFATIIWRFLIFVLKTMQHDIILFMV